MAINSKRVVLGGLAGGLLNNLCGIGAAHFLFQQEIEATLKRMNLTFGLDVALQHVGMRLAVGIAVTWLYAAIRPRFGPGPRTALVAGTAMWFFAYVWGYLGVRPYQIFSDRTLLLAAIWGLAEINLTALLGAWLYRE